MRKGPDGKTIKPSGNPAGKSAGESDDGATRKVQRKSIRDRIASAESGEDSVVTHIADDAKDPAPDDDATAVAGSPAAADTPPPVSPKTAPSHSEREPGASAPAGGDPNVTQVYRPNRGDDGDEGESADGPDLSESGTISDPVVGWMVIVDGPGRGGALPIGYGNNRIGRAPAEQICLDFGDEQISRENHAVVTYDGRHRKFYVQQGGGRNLTHVNDELVMVPVEVEGGEILSIGRTKLRFVPFCGPDFDWQEEE